MQYNLIKKIESLLNINRFLCVFFLCVTHNIRVRKWSTRLSLNGQKTFIFFLL